MRRSKNKANRIVKERRMYGKTINSILRSEPVIRITDRRNRYETLRRIQRAETKAREQGRKEETFSLAPRRTLRRIRNMYLSRVFPDTYKKIHNCKQEWRKLLSWRSGQGAGRKRTQRELQNNKSSFQKKDC